MFNVSISQNINDFTVNLSDGDQFNVTFSPSAFTNTVTFDNSNDFNVTLATDPLTYAVSITGTDLPNIALTTNSNLPTFTINQTPEFTVTISDSIEAINGIPAGGTANQYLKKTSSTDFATAWDSFVNASASTTGFLTSTDWNTFNNKINLSSISASLPLSYNSTTGVISLPISGGFVPLGIPHTDGSGNFYQDANFTYDPNLEVLKFSQYGQLNETSDDIKLLNTRNNATVIVGASGEITLKATTAPGDVLVSDIYSDLAQIVGPTIQDSGAATVIDYTSTLKFYYASSDLAWDIEGGQIWWPGGSGTFVDMVFGYMSDQVGTPFMDIAQRIFSDEIGNNAIEFSSGGIGMYNKVSRYNGTLTAGQGMASIYYEYKTTGTTGAISNNYTTNSTAGMYRVSVTCVVTSAWTAGTLSCTLSWRNGAAQTKTLFTGLALSTLYKEDQYVGSFDVEGGTTISISTTLTGTTGSGNYRFKSIVERIG